MKTRRAWSSHLPALVKALAETKGDVLEMGVGLFSTPFLNWMCLYQNRNLVSYENEADWNGIKKHFETDYHKIHFITDWDKADIDREWAVAFIDHAPAGRRIVDIARVADKAQLVVVHDTQRDKRRSYNYHKIEGLFKYRYDFDKEKPYTTVFSNFIDVSKWKKE